MSTFPVEKKDVILQFALGATWEDFFWFIIHINEEGNRESVHGILQISLNAQDLERALSA